MKTNYFIWFICWSLFFVTLSRAEHHLGIFNFKKKYPSECDNPNNPCYTITDLVKRSLVFSPESREAIELLYQAKKEVKVRMGNILSNLNIYSLLTFSLDKAINIDTILPFVGFFFPNRWHDWKSSKHLFNAEKESLATIFANRVQTIQNLYFNIQMQIWAIRIIEFYYQEIEFLIAFLKEQKIDNRPRASRADIAILENIKGNLMFQRAFVDALSSVLPKLATAIGLDPSFDWYRLRIEPYSLSAVNNIVKEKYDNLWPVALLKSSEVRNVGHLIKAAKENKKSITFDFFDPSSGNNLGFGYSSRIKIARSKIEVLNIQFAKTKMQLSNAIQDSLNNFNDAVDSFPGVLSAIIYLEDIRSDVESHINEINVPLEINKIIRYFEFAKGQAMNFIFSYFVIHSAQADLNRYTWHGELYEIVYEYVDEAITRVSPDKKKKCLKNCC